MRTGAAKPVAIGGLLAALAVVIMCLGGLIPIATYVCPVMCMLLGQLVLRLCGSRIAWAWYGAVSILSILLTPDIESAAIYLSLGYYPIIKQRLDKLPLSWLWKEIYFNAIIICLYAALIHLIGMDALAKEFSGIGIFGLVLILFLGNVTFLLLDRLLSRFGRRYGR